MRLDPTYRATVPARAPEYATVDAFAAYLADEDRDSFTADDLAILGVNTHLPVHELRAGLKAYGFALAHRESVKTVRGVHANDHNRWG